MKYFLLILFVFSYLQASEQKLEDAQFKFVKLDDYLKGEEPLVARLAGKKMIKQGTSCSFVANIKQLPKEKKGSYIYTALQIAQIRPIPEVTHQMFIESAAGKIFSVYVEKEAAEKLLKNHKAEEKLKFSAFHVYTYKRGPAFLLVDFSKAEQEK